MAPLSILFGASLTVAAAWGAGRLLFRRVAAPLTRAEAHALAFIAGSGILSLIVFLLAAAHLATRGVLLATGLALIASGARWGRRIPETFPPLPRRWLALFAIAIIPFTLLYFFSAMAPEFSPDGASYHLSLVDRYARAHGLVPVPWNMYAHLSQAIEMLFLMAYSFGQGSAAALVHYAFLIALTTLIVSYGRRAGYPLAGLGAALLIYLSPMFAIDATSAYIDVAVAAILFAVFYVFELYSTDRELALAAIGGLLGGYAYGAKYTAAVALLYAAFRLRRLRPLAVACACAIPFIAPWLIKNALWAANPFAPLANRWFPNPFVHISMEQGWLAYLRTYNLPSLWQIPLEVTTRGEALNGLLGPAFLFVPLGLAALRLPIGRRLLGAGALFAIPYGFNIGTRFLIPCAPYFAFALALALSELPILLATLLIAHAVLSWPAVIYQYAAPHPWILGRIPFKPALRLESARSWLGRKQPEFAYPMLLEDKVRPGARVLAFGGIAEAYTRRDVWVSFQSARGEVAADIFQSAFLGDFQPRCAEQLRFPETTLRKLRIVQTAAPVEALQWNVGEVRVFSAGRELARAPEWRLTARPNPWDIQLAFDQSPVTRWRSWQRFEPGMFIEIDFGSPRQAGEVRLEGPYDCPAHNLRIEGMTESGAWSVLTDQRTISPNPVGPFLGRTAMRELKARGFDYLFIRAGDYGWAEVSEHPEAWGLRVAGEAGSAKLYEIEGAK